MNENQTRPEEIPAGNPAPQIKGFKKHVHSFWEIIEFAVIALIIVIPIRAFVAQPFIVSGTSMVPTFKNSDYLIVDEISYRLEKPARGDVIVFKYPKDTTKFFIKRVIGLPGETVEINGSSVTIINSEHPDGLVLSEPYIKNEATNYMKTTLGEHEYFVMGDNRSASSDSRSWGTLPDKLIVGRAFLRILPFKEAGVFPGEATYAK